MFFKRKAESISGSFVGFREFIKNTWSRLLVFSKEALQKINNLSETNMNLGLYYYYSGHFNDAAMRFTLLSWFGSNAAKSNYNLGRCYYMLGQDKKAAKYLQKSLAAKDDLTESKYFLQKIDDPTSVSSIPSVLIAERFDFSDPKDDIFDEKPQNFLLNSIKPYFNNSPLSVLELGCSSGTLGKVLRQYVAHCYLEGVDISAKMIEQTRDLKTEGRMVYNNLSRAEIGEFLQDCKIKYDIIVSKGVFGHLGLSRQILHLCREILKPQGILVFFASKAKGYLQFMPYRDKFSYSTDYLTNAANEAQFSVLNIKDVSDKLMLCSFTTGS